jgi:predicted PurR-regulated permease PerM
MALFVPLLVDQLQGMTAFWHDLMSHPGQDSRILTDLAARFGFTSYLPRLQEWLQSLSSQLTVVAGGVLSYTTRLLNSFAALATMLFIAYYLLLDGQRVIANLLQHIPQAQRSRAQRILDQSAGAVSGYVTGDIFISVICGGAAFVVLMILGIPYAGALALLLALLDLIPGNGATLGGAVLVLAGLFVSPWTGLILLIYFILYQQAENYLLQPLVYSHRVHLHPLMITIAMLLGGAWMGLAGVLLAIPAAEIIRCIAVEWFAKSDSAG